MAKSIEEIITERFEEVIEKEELELVDVEYVKEGSDWFLRVFIDKEDGVNLDDCEKISRIISEDLDENDPVAQAYHLEVSSPGIERPLKKTRDFIRFKGETIFVKTYATINSRKKFQGILEEASEEEIVLSVDDEKISIPREKIAKANLTWE